MTSLLAPILRLQVSNGYSIASRSSSSTKKWMEWKPKEFMRMRGYTPPYHSGGLMARLKDDPGPVVNTFPRKPDPWHPKVALYGQNDFIDILGDGSIHPTRIMTNVPKWLRGVDRKTNEIAMINRRIQIHPHWKSLRPEKYYQFRKRIDFLFRYLNGKKRPPPPDHY